MPEQKGLEFRKIFQTSPRTLCEMITNARNGMTYSALARKYDVDHTTIIHWCRKYGIGPLSKDQSNSRIQEVMAARTQQDILLAKEKRANAKLEANKLKIKRISPSAKFYIDDNGEKINLGKNYKYYVAKSKQRALRLKTASVSNNTDGRHSQQSTNGNHGTQGFWRDGSSR